MTNLRLLLAALLIAMISSCEQDKKETSTNFKTSKKEIYATVTLDIKEQATTFIKIINRTLNSVKSEDKNSSLFKKSLITIRDFLAMKHNDIPATIKALEFVESCSIKNNYKYLSKKEIEGLKSLINKWISYNFSVVG